jgi:ribosomal protein S18 acetylase RimI-like enzyme
MHEAGRDNFVYQQREIETDPKAYFTALLSEAQNTPLEPTQRRRLESKLTEHREKYFSSTATPFDQLTITDQLRFAVSFSLIPEAQGNISQALAYRLTNNLQFSNTEALRKYITQSSLENQVDSALYLSTLLASARAIDTTGSMQTVLHEILNHLEDDSRDNAFLAYAFQYVRHEFASEYTQLRGTDGIKTRNQTIGRQTISPSAINQALDKQLKQQYRDTLSLAGTYQTVARDALGIIDHAGFPYALLSIETQRQPEQVTDQIRNAQRVIEYLEQPLPSPITFYLDQILEFVDAKILPEDADHFSEWQQLYPELSSQEWQEYWEALNKLREVKRVIDTHQSETRQKVDDLNFSIWQETINSARAIVEMQSITNPFYSQLVAKLFSPDDNSADNAFATLASISKHQPDAPDFCHEVARLFKKWYTITQENTALATSQIHAFYATEMQKTMDLRDQKAKLAAKIQPDKILGAIKRLVLEITQDDTRSVIKPSTYHETLQIYISSLNITHKTSDPALLLQEIHRPQIRPQLENDLGLSLAELSLREQVQLVVFLAEAQIDVQQRVFALTKKFGLPAAQAFLAGEYGAEYLQTVLAIGEQLDAEAATKIFKAYADISTIAQDSVAEIATRLTPTRAQNLNQNAVQNQLLHHAKNLLVKALETQTPEKFISLLERYKTDVITFASIFEQAYTQFNDFALEDFQDLRFESTHADALSETTKQQMLVIFDNNWKGQNPDIAEYFKDKLKSALEHSSDKTKFYVLYKENRVAAFIRIDDIGDIEDHAAYAGSLNVDANLRGHSLGNALMDRTLAVEAQTKILQAEVDPDTEAVTRYVEDGFVITGVKPLETNKDVLLLRIQRHDAINDQYASRKMTIEELITNDLPKGVRVAAFDCSHDNTQFIKAIDDAAQRGEVATRYWRDPKNQTMRYLAFETAETNQ